MCMGWPNSSLQLAKEMMLRWPEPMSIGLDIIALCKSEAALIYFVPTADSLCEFFFLLVFRSSFTPQTNTAPRKPSLCLPTQMWPRFILEFHLSGYFRHIPTSTILSMWTWILSYQTQSHKVGAVQFTVYQEMCADTPTVTHKTKCVTILQGKKKTNKQKGHGVILERRINFD